MQPIINNLLNIKRPSIALIILAWLSFNFNSIFVKSPASISEIIILIFSIIVLEITSFFLNYKNIISFIILNTVLFLFGYLIILNFQSLFNNIFGIFLRGRIFFFPLFFVANFLMIFVNKKINYNFFNSFLLLFIFVNIIMNFISLSKQSQTETTYSSKKATFKKSNNIIPILLLILDEYHSPDDLFSNTKDSSLFNFSNMLKNKGWQTNTSFHSKEVSTNRSLCSMFNYNLSYDKNFIRNKEYIDGKLFDDNLLYNDLKNKDVKIINWGIFNFGTINSKSNFYTLLPKHSILKRIIQNTSIHLILTNTKGLKPSAFKSDYYPITEHNMQTISNLKNTLRLNTKTFIYSHLVMPHSPFYYPNKFNFKSNALNNYIEFWKFTNSIVQNTIEANLNSNNIKIIITGDHGFRHSTNLNKNKTFLALYGFESINIKEVKTVQDLGSLINSNF